MHLINHLNRTEKNSVTLYKIHRGSYANQHLCEPVISLRLQPFIRFAAFFVA